MPSVSVVVPARDAGAWLPACRAALGAQEVEHELVLVDDGSREPLAGARVRLSPARGAAAARNAGVAAASGEVVAFTDADCAPAPGWLTAALAALDAGADVVQGPVVPPPGAHVGPFDRTLRVTAPSPLFETANLVVRRAWLERAGGFAAPVAAGGRPFGEDAWLGHRLRRAGARVAWAPDAVVHHAVVPRGPLAVVAEEARLAHFAALVRTIPELRDELLRHRLFLGARHEEAVLALAGVALARRRPAAAVLVLPYARRLAREAAPWGRRAPAVAAVRAAADAVGLAAALAGSARSGRLVV